MKLTSIIGDFNLCIQTPILSSLEDFSRADQRRPYLTYSPLDRKRSRLNVLLLSFDTDLAETVWVTHLFRILKQGGRDWLTRIETCELAALGFM
jgi:hypothetical protein